jgi:prephenate dehydrogenase
MCGDHRSGYGAARPDLYAGCTVYVTPAGNARATETVTALWQSLGARVLNVKAEAHDETIAKISHLPQVIASVLAATLSECGVSARDLGPGGRDTSRIAGSDPLLWTDILLHNRVGVAAVLEHMRNNLESLQRHLSAGDAEQLYTVLERGSDWRRGAS